MGAWGIGIIEDDMALDWVWELQESKGTSLLRSSFNTVNQAQYREAPDCSSALAAAEVVAAMLGKPMNGLPEDIEAWIKSNPIAIDKELQASAWNAVDHVLVDSELKELWEETDDYAQWQAVLRDLMSRLAVDP